MSAKQELSMKKARCTMLPKGTSSGAYSRTSTGSTASPTVPLSCPLSYPLSPSSSSSPSALGYSAYVLDDRKRHQYTSINIPTAPYQLFTCTTMEKGWIYITFKRKSAKRSKVPLIGVTDLVAVTDLVTNPAVTKRPKIVAS